MSEPIYETAPVDAPEIVCPFCGEKTWHEHEHKPGFATVIQCNRCARPSVINITGFSSAVREYRDDLREALGEATALLEKERKKK
ncbi:MAG TPA: hypothetical protein VJQ82_17995 [Terriglobales bacterium]|nr:hypothetical protein [Terriglobales bacterium]